MAFGERLQREREMRGITLEEIAKATKIGTRSLRALEEEDFRKLPGGIFNKGFVRAYARYLGIDEEQAVTDYMAALGEPDDPALDSERLKRLEVNWKPPKREELGALEGRRIPWSSVIVVVVLIALAVAAWHYRYPLGQRWHQWRARHHSENVVPMQAARQTTNAAASSAATESVADPKAPEPAKPAAQTDIPAATSSPPPASVPENSAREAKPGKGMVLQIRAREDAWISVEADGTRAARGVLAARSERTIRAQKTLKLTTGNAGGVDLFLNGKPIPRLGDPKQTRTVTFTPQGMELKPLAVE